ncbi:mevalonate kinase [Enterococcus columbae]|uniref:Mevalonate kinase n=1 Tax=Enterococcus columbae DSM 7374 = ATCC 51263 TaxID=1121865 RepID=S0K0V2_9ENTE|nr:mevalonate kinase [Enterococcus columbae]EOT38152.1 mevalonate kinase [Enterococcus columbae DSM 7374 = ATCC 51263]EOW83819.1 mevalonate kinase [Enterococcus columbae DSM 7374 = ATCC 51263]OJG24766.1 mevalonate kinase [Enterococcus columbae DSM 7374 = ATCC 51263]
MKEHGIGQATGKIILIGEHAVVYGQPAIAFPFNGVGVTATVQKATIDTLDSAYFTGKFDQLAHTEQMQSVYRLIQKLKNDLQAPNFALKIESTIPAERGMGSSAAVAVAITRAFFDWQEQTLTDEALTSYVNFSEQIAHDNPSGIDAAATSGTNPILFEKGQPYQHFPLNIDAYLLVADTQIKGRTREAVKAVAELKKVDPDTVDMALNRLGRNTKHAQQAIIHNQSALLGKVMTDSHYVLRYLSVSNELLDRAVLTAINHGALGAKLTGGGRGGCLLVLTDTLATAQKIQEQFAQLGITKTWLQGLGVYQNA